MGWYDGGTQLLQEERSVRFGENVLVTSITFALFWANFGLSWYLSSRRVREFSSFTSAQKADWCSRVNSTIHAVLVVIGVAYALADITWASGFMPMSSIRAASFIFSIAIGYFLCDLIIIIIWPVPMQWVFIVHHIVAVYVMGLFIPENGRGATIVTNTCPIFFDVLINSVPYFINNFISCCAACQFGLLLFLLVELATLPLNARGFLDARNRQDSKNYMRSIYITYIVWGLSRMALPTFLIYALWAYTYPSDRNHDTCFFPNLVSAHIIALFCIGVFFFVHTPEMIQIRREHHRAHGATDLSSEVAVNTDDADLEVSDVPSSKASKSSSIRSLTLSLSRPKELIADDSYDDIELGVMPRSARTPALLEEEQ